MVLNIFNLCSFYKNELAILLDVYLVVVLIWIYMIINNMSVFNVLIGYSHAFFNEVFFSKTLLIFYCAVY